MSTIYYTEFMKLKKKKKDSLHRSWYNHSTNIDNISEFLFFNIIRTRAQYIFGKY